VEYKPEEYWAFFGKGESGEGERGRCKSLILRFNVGGNTNFIYAYIETTENVIQ